MKGLVPWGLLWACVGAGGIVACGSSDDDANTANDAGDGGVAASSSSSSGSSGGASADGSGAMPSDATTGGNIDGGQAMDATGDETVPLADATPDASTDGRAASQCSGSPDCKVASDYCGGCTCVALGAGESLPACNTTPVTCIVDPCSGHSATCGANGACAVSP
jgi:hypothetical protein